MSECCTKCAEIKPRDSFKPYKRKRNGLSSWCRACENEDGKAWRIKDRVRFLNKRWRQTKGPAYHSVWRKAHRKVLSVYNAKWRSANPEKVKAHSRRAEEKRRNNARDLLARTVSASIRKSLARNKAGYSWEALLGYTAEDLMRHLEKLFRSGMSWENRGAWHIDHVVPISAFRYEKPTDPEFVKCWALANLQPLWAADNLRKRNHIPGAP